MFFLRECQFLTPVYSTSLASSFSAMAATSGASFMLTLAPKMPPSSGGREFHDVRAGGHFCFLNLPGATFN